MVHGIGQPRPIGSGAGSDGKEGRQGPTEKGRTDTDVHTDTDIDIGIDIGMILSTRQHGAVVAIKKRCITALRINRGLGCVYTRYTQQK